MCGISGIVAFDDNQQPAGLNNSLQALRFRGPDESTMASGAGWAVGARRLRIVGTGNGSQPFFGRQGTVCVFNGEIYNHKELRATLQSKGIVFGTESDGEVIALLYEEFGLGFVDHLRGMFACAIYHPGTQRLILARDRIGKKPLFYGPLAGRKVVFGSSLNSVLAFDEVRHSIEPEAISHFLSYRVIPAPLTIYRGIHKLEAGCMLVIDPKKSEMVRYWTYPQCETSPPQGGEDDVVEELTSLLDAAVRTRIPSEVPYGFFLSGGLDSAVVAALQQRRQGEPLHTYSVGFAQTAFDERPHARELARHLGSEHHEYEITASDALKTQRELLWHFGEPHAFPSSIACYQMSRLARERGPVVLGGDGADELFAGYGRYKRFLQQTGRSAAGIDCGAGADERLAEDYDAVLTDGLKAPWKAQLLSKTLVEALGPLHPRNLLRSRIRPSGNVECLNRILALDGALWLTDAQMCKVDVASMAHSVEVRHPFLDETVVDFASKLPAHYKLRDGEEKYILRRAAKPILPAGTLNRAKQELALPIESWLNRELRDHVVKTLTAPACLERGYFEPDQLRAFATKANAGNHYALWTLYVLEQWHLQHHDEAFR